MEQAELDHLMPYQSVEPEELEQLLFARSVEQVDTHMTSTQMKILVNMMKVICFHNALSHPHDVQTYAMCEFLKRFVL
jgi:hypothetical protein